MIRSVGVVRLVWMVRPMRVVRVVRVPGPVGVTGLAVTVTVTPPARTLNLLRLRPFSILVTFQFLVGIEAGL